MKGTTWRKEAFIKMDHLSILCFQLSVESGECYIDKMHNCL